LGAIGGVAVGDAGGEVALRVGLGAAVDDCCGGVSSSVQAVRPAVLSAIIVSSAATGWRPARPPTMHPRVPTHASNVRCVPRLWIGLRGRAVKRGSGAMA
jgi:hypothetical protein